MSSRRRLLPSVASLRLRSSWRSWRRSRATRRLARELERTQALLGLLAQREARLQVALQLQELTDQAALLRVQELLADLSTPEQPAPQPEPLSPVTAWQEVHPETAEASRVLAQLPRRPEPMPLQVEQEPPPAEEQLWSELGLSTTQSSAPSSGS